MDVTAEDVRRGCERMDERWSAATGSPRRKDPERYTFRGTPAGKELACRVARISREHPEADIAGLMALLIGEPAMRLAVAAGQGAAAVHRVLEDLGLGRAVSDVEAMEAELDDERRRRMTAEERARGLDLDVQRRERENARLTDTASRAERALRQAEAERWRLQDALTAVRRAARPALAPAALRCGVFGLLVLVVIGAAGVAMIRNQGTAPLPVAVHPALLPPPPIGSCRSVLLDEPISPFEAAAPLPPGRPSPARPDRLHPLAAP